MTNRVVLAAAAAVLMLWVASLDAWAGVTKNIQFGPGKRTGEVSNAVVRGDRDTYTLRARAGQRMEVKITAVENNAAFVIYKPGKDDTTLLAAGERDDATQWSGLLSVTGVYRIVVGGTRGNATYKLTVTVR